MYSQFSRPGRFAAAIITMILANGFYGISTARAEGGININASMNVAGDVIPKDTGLSVFPGAKAVDGAGHRDGKGVNVQLTLGGFGAKVVVVKMRAEAPMEAIAAFYQDDLARYGEVLDCSRPRTAEARAERKTRPDRDDRLTCKGETAPRDGMLFRAGTNTNQRVVSIRPHDGGTEFTLVHVKLRLPAWMQENIAINP